MAFTSGPRIGSSSVAISVGAGTNALVSPTSGKRVRVYSYAAVADAAGTIKFINTGGTDLTGAMSFAINGGISCAPGDDPYFSTDVGSGLSIVTSAGVKGHLSYVIE